MTIKYIRTTGYDSWMAKVNSPKINSVRVLVCELVCLCSLKHVWSAKSKAFIRYSALVWLAESHSLWHQSYNNLLNLVFVCRQQLKKNVHLIWIGAMKNTFPFNGCIVCASLLHSPVSSSLRVISVVRVLAYLKEIKYHVYSALNDFL